MKHALFAAVFLATPAAAQDRMTPEQCNGGMAALEAIVGVPLSDASFEPDNEGWCQTEDGIFPVDGATRMRIGSLRWRAADIERFIADNLPPRSIEIRGQGFAIVPETGDPLYDYLLGIQTTQAETVFGISVRWDGVQNAVIVDDAFVNFDATNGIEATARIDGVNLTDQTSMQMSAGSMGLRELTIKSDFAGWFETYVAFGLGAALLRDGEVSPETQVTELQHLVVEFIRKLPVVIMSEASGNALSAFVMTLPNPRGRAQLQLNATSPLGAARMAPFAVLPDEPTPEQLVELGLEGVTILFTWATAGGTQ